MDFFQHTSKWRLTAGLVVATTLLSGCGDPALKAFKAQPCGSTTIGGMLDLLAVKQEWHSEAQKEGAKKTTATQRISLTAHFKPRNSEPEILLLVVDGTAPQDGEAWQFVIQQMDVTTDKGTQHVTAAQPQYLATMYCQAQDDFAVALASNKE